MRTAINNRILYSAGACWLFLITLGGVEARRFHGETSGHVVLYDPQGQRLFDGGITASRGHAGDSPGLGALLALLHKQTSRQWHTAIFGCRIRDDS